MGWVLWTGGRGAGVMDVASRGAKSRGGLTVGILPDPDSDPISEAVDIPILTGIGQGGNVISFAQSPDPHRGHRDHENLPGAIWIRVGPAGE